MIGMSVHVLLTYFLAESWLPQVHFVDNFAEYVEKSTGITTIKEDEELIKYSDGPHSVVRTTCIYTSLLYA